jgi:hypothetical protein
MDFYVSNKRFRPGSLGILFSVVIPVFLRLTWDLITESLYYVYDVNKGVFLASDICFMFMEHPEVSYLIMILVVFVALYWYDKREANIYEK